MRSQECFMPIKALPDELWVHIFKLACIDGGPTGCSLAAVSRYVRETSRTARLQSVALISINDVLAFHRAFVRGQEPDNNVKNLLISIDDEDYWGSTKIINMAIREKYELSEPKASPSLLWRKFVQRLHLPVQLIRRRHDIHFRDLTREQRVSFIRQSILDVLHYARPGLVSLTISMGASLFPVVLPKSLPALQFLSVNAMLITHNITPETFPALTSLDLHRYVDLPKILTSTSSLKYLRLSSPAYLFTLFFTQFFNAHDDLEESREPLLTQLGKYADLRRIVFVLNEDHDWFGFGGFIDDVESDIPSTPDVVNNQNPLPDTSEVGSFTEQDHLIVFCPRSLEKDPSRGSQLQQEWVKCNENGYPCWVNWWGVPWVLPTPSGPT